MDGEVAAEIGIPDTAKVILSEWDEASERHVTANIPKAAVGTIDAVIKVPRSV